MFSMRSALSPKVFSGNDNHYLNQIHLLCFRSELFQQDLKYKNISSAKRHYVFNALGFITKSFFWKRQSLPESNPFIMLPIGTISTRFKIQKHLIGQTPLCFQCARLYHQKFFLETTIIT